MNIIIMSRKEIEAFVFPPKSVAICIAYPTGRFHKVEPDCKSLLAVHHTRFSDCDENAKWSFPETKTGENKPVPMTRGQAIDIIEFVNRWKDRAENLYIACYGGISRSAGVGAGIAVVFGFDDGPCYGQGVSPYSQVRIPNVHCKSLIIREREDMKRGE